MQEYISQKVGRTFILKLDPGDDILESIELLINRNDIENAVIVSGLATLDRANLHMITTTDYPIKLYMRNDKDLPLELTSIDGFICDKEPHLHCTLSDKNTAYGGHIHKGCRTLYIGEIVIQELLGLNITRHINEKGANTIYEK